MYSTCTVYLYASRDNGEGWDVVILKYHNNGTGATLVDVESAEEVINNTNSTAHRPKWVVQRLLMSQLNLNKRIPPTERQFNQTFNDWIRARQQQPSTARRPTSVQHASIPEQASTHTPIHLHTTYRTCLRFCADHSSELKVSDECLLHSHSTR